MCESDCNGRPFFISGMESLHPTVKFHIQLLCRKVRYTGNSETVMWWSAGSALLTTLWTKRYGVRTQGGARGFYLVPNVRNDNGDYPGSYSVDTVVCSSGLKRPGREACHLPPSGAEVKNEWS
jgi:hypothetical protein